MTRVYHLVVPPTWTAAVDTGRYAPASLSTEGFIHMSFAHQVAASANRFFEQAGSLWAVAFSAEELGDALVVEDTTGHGDFPHLYRAIDPAEAVDVIVLQRLDGDWSFTDKNVSNM
jgi:uncharacterized protein (DUF952 family)